MNTLVHFMNSPLGRTLRVALGVVMIVFGLLIVGGFAGTLLAVIGLLPLTLATTGRCLLEPFAHTTH